MKIIILYDGTTLSKKALHYGIRKAKASDGQLLVLHVFPATLFIDYDAGPHAEKLAREEAAGHASEAREIILSEGGGIPVRFIPSEGDPCEVLLSLASSENPDLILVTPRYKKLVRFSSYPVYVLPGTLLVPVDSTDAIMDDLEAIVREADASGSRVLLLGIIPVHLYGSEEKEELERLEKKTAMVLQNVKKTLLARGTQTSQIVRRGYPDEEILKTIFEYGVSLIMMPGGRKSPSELTKAAAVLLEESERMHVPIQILQTER